MRDRYTLFCRLLDEFDKGCNLTKEYDMLLHDYNGEVLYQAESQMIKIIGNNPGITAAEISKEFHTTSSATSQLIRKLKAKKFVMQKRNAYNKREYRLYLTAEGTKIHKNHHEFETCCYNRSFKALDEFSEKDLYTYIKIQEKLNETFELDVEESKENC